jgi:hypothetical protein
MTDDAKDKTVLTTGPGQSSCRCNAGTRARAQVHALWPDIDRKSIPALMAIGANIPAARPSEAHNGAEKL